MSIMLYLSRSSKNIRSSLLKRTQFCRIRINSRLSSKKAHTPLTERRHNSKKTAAQARNTAAKSYLLLPRPFFDGAAGRKSRRVAFFISTTRKS